MRRTIHFIALGALLAVGCKATIPDDTFACTVDSDCPDGFSCSAGFCSSSGGGSDAGGMDGGTLDAGDIDAGDVDAGGTDAGGTDAGTMDAGDVDAGRQPENTVAACGDGLDNDGDGLFDCDDAECCATGACLVGTGACDCPDLVARPEIIVSGDVAAGTVWSCDLDYVLDGEVYVPTGELTIGPGTRVRAGFGGALAIQRDARLNARGTAARPIVFTTTTEIGIRARGDWGGIVLLGDAPINHPSGETTLPILDSTRTLYGGTNDANDCGTVEYLTIGYSGSTVSGGFAAAGIAFVGCGTGTTASHIQSYASGDVGVYVAGGTMRLDHVMAWANDAGGFFYSEGWTGGLQYGYLTDNGANSVTGFTSFADTSRRPVSSPDLLNLTMTDSGGAAFFIGPEAGGRLSNSLFGQTAATCVQVDTTADGLIPALLSVRDTLFWNCGGAGGTDFIDGVGAAAFQSDASFGNRFEDHGTFGPDWVPPTGSAPAAGAGPPPASYDTTSYVGAFVPGATAWTDGWVQTTID